jgi:hypothetical protein
MPVILTLGDVIFEDFEVPERINFGGKQALIVHKLPGGDRIIDAMGRDDDDISWSGRFRGGFAETRARNLDYLRIQGQPLTLTWSTFRYQVLIESFKADFEQFYEVPYSITCTVLADEFGGIASLLAGIDEALGTDLNSALSLGGAISLSTITTAVTGVQSAIAAVQTVKNANLTSIASIVGSLGAAQGAAQSAITAAGSVLNTIGSVGGVVAGGNPASMAASLTGQASAFGQLNQLYQLSSTVGRMATNMANAGS